MEKISKRMAFIAKKVIAGSTAQALFDAMIMDMHPSNATEDDFGLNVGSSKEQQQKYEALYYPIRSEEITLQDLIKVLGNGKAITKLVRRCPSNPHKNIVFTTIWDDMG